MSFRDTPVVVSADTLKTTQSLVVVLESLATPCEGNKKWLNRAC